MALTKLHLENFTVFEKIDMEFSKGLNVFIGENATGKTHALKVLYSACQAAQAKSTAIDFQRKLVRVFRPDNLELHRLVRRSPGNKVAVIKVSSGKNTLSMEFSSKPRGSNPRIRGEESWAELFQSLTSTFIPAHEILSNSRNLIQAIDKNNVDFDDTYRDLISAASVNLNIGPESTRQKKYLSSLYEITTGRVLIENEKFYLKPGNQSKLEFQLVAEGIRKIALLWQLIKNGTLESGSILFWDEPESNINPKHLPALADMLLKLESDGVQIFVATHDYIFAKYLELNGEGKNDIRFFSFYKSENDISVESCSNFRTLKNNPISKAFDLLLDKVYDMRIDM